jgi:hypothetical protein
MRTRILFPIALALAALGVPCVQAMDHNVYVLVESAGPGGEPCDPELDPSCVCETGLSNSAPRDEEQGVGPVAGRWVIYCV